MNAIDTRKTAARPMAPVASLLPVDPGRDPRRASMPRAMANSAFSAPNKLKNATKLSANAAIA